MSLFNQFKLQQIKHEYLTLEKLNQMINNLPFNKLTKSQSTVERQYKQNKFVYFCEHDGICIHFTRARSSWHALAPCALKPWWLSLNPLKRNKKLNR